MVQNGTRTVAIAIYGLVVIASGMVRYFGAEGGETGLIFGLVMGTISLVAAACFCFNQNLTGMILAWLCILFTGGWFIYEALIKKGISEAETRQLVVIGISLLTAVALAYPRQQSVKDKPPTHNKKH